MSEPNLPDKPDLTREDVINIILASIGMEELGLSHIINAEGEKLQYVLGTTEGTSGAPEPVTVRDLLKVNKSVRETLSNTARLQMLLNTKMETAMSASTMQGTTGPAGPQGTTGPAGPQGPVGPEGPQGIQGIAGTVGTIKGSYESEQELRNAHPEGGNPGDFYYIDPDLWVWDEDNNDWINVGQIAGPQGLQGFQGIQGERGETGPTGPTGPKGDQGQTGSMGPRGPEGTDGKDGRDGEAATIAAGKVTILPYNEPPTVENVGTSTNAIFNFGIPEGPPRVRVYKANLSAPTSQPLQIPLGNAIFYQLHYSTNTELSLFFKPLTGLAQARCDYRVVSQYDATFVATTTFDARQENYALITQASPAIDITIYNNTREMHKTWIRVQNPNNAALWSVYEVNLFSSQNGARIIVWVNVIDEDGSY